MPVKKSQRRTLQARSKSKHEGKARARRGERRRKATAHEGSKRERGGAGGQQTRQKRRHSREAQEKEEAQQSRSTREQHKRQKHQKQTQRGKRSKEARRTQAEGGEGHRRRKQEPNCLTASKECVLPKWVKQNRKTNTHVYAKALCGPTGPQTRCKRKQQMEFEQIACVHIDAKFVSTNMYHVGVITNYVTMLT